MLTFVTSDQQCLFTSKLGVYGWQKMTSVRFSVRFCKKNCGFKFGFVFTKLAAVSFFLVGFLHLSVDAIFRLRLYGMTLEMT